MKMCKTSITYILVFLVAVAAILAAFLPCTTACAAVESADNVFINPVAIATSCNTLFVADNVSDGKSVILCYDVTNPQPKYTHSVKLDKSVLTLSPATNGLTVVFDDSIVTYDLTGGKLAPSEIKATITTEKYVVDVCEGPLEEQTVTYYIADYLFAMDGGKEKNISGGKLSNARAVISVGDYVYYVAEGQLKRYNGTEREYETEDKFNDGVKMPENFVPTGLFSYENGSSSYVAVYNKKAVYRVAQNSDNSYEAASAVLTSANNIVDVALASKGAYVLNDLNKVVYYAQEGDLFTEREITIGSDTIELDTPNGNFTGFVLAQPLDYPTNIVYKTKNANSIAEIEKQYTGEYVILQYEGYEESRYYYVLVGDKYGWVKKSDGAETPELDDKIKVLGNGVEDNVNFVVKFNSLNAVYVYNMPIKNSDYADVFNQKATELKEAKLLQRFENGSETWYYVQYQNAEGQTKKGFVPQGAVSKFSASSINVEYETIVGDRKINASLFSAVSLYLGSERKEGTEISNDNGVVKLYSGQLVKVIKQEGDAALLQVLYGDGSCDYGWIDASRLIGIDDMTTNSTVGLIALGIALVLVCVLIGIFLRRRKLKAQGKIN